MNIYYIQDGLTPGATYQFKLKAVNYIGAGPFSSIISIIAASVPQPPVNLRRVSLNVDTVVFEWDENPDNGGSTVVDYYIYWDQGNFLKVDDDFVIADATSYLTK